MTASLCPRPTSVGARTHTASSRLVVTLSFTTLLAVGSLAAAQESPSGSADDENSGGVQLEISPPQSEPTYELKETEDGHLVRWQDTTFKMVLAPTTAVSSIRARRDLLAAMRTWDGTAVTPTIVLDEEESDVRTAALDGVNAVFFVEEGWEFDPKIVALTFTHVRTRDGAIVEMDLAVNAEFFNFDPNDAGDEVVHDLQSVFTHELGHAFGLPDFPTAPEATMYSQISAGQTSPRDLDAIDIDAITELYLHSDPDEAPPANGCPSAPPTTFAGLFFALALRRRLGRVARHVGAVAVIALVIPFVSPAVNASGTSVATGWVVSREAPRQTNGILPATDLVIRAQDGSLLRVRVPGKATGEIQPRVLHFPIPTRGDEVGIAPFATPIDLSRRH